MCVAMNCAREEGRSVAELFQITVPPLTDTKKTVVGLESTLMTQHVYCYAMRGIMYILLNFRYERFKSLNQIEIDLKYNIN